MHGIPDVLDQRITVIFRYFADGKSDFIHDTGLLFCGLLLIND